MPIMPLQARWQVLHGAAGSTCLGTDGSQTSRVINETLMASSKCQVFLVCMQVMRMMQMLFSPTLEQMSGLGPSNADACECTFAQAQHHHLDGRVLSERRQKLAMLEQVLEDLGIDA